jgi:uncharacterized protein DUF3455
VPVAARPPIPAALAVPATQVLSTELHASGAQIYDCKPSKDDPARFEWVFVAPEAELRDHAGTLVGKHSAGPTWAASDGSTVVGTVVARDPGPDASAIPWLLLSATSATGHGVFDGTRSIQRLHTVGGKAPLDGCDATQSGKQARISYSADYLFYANRR